MAKIPVDDFKFTALVQGDEKNKWFIASDTQLELLRAAGVNRLSMRGEGRFHTIEAVFGAAEGMPEYMYSLTPLSERYCKEFILENLETGKKRLVIVVETPEFV